MSGLTVEKPKLELGISNNDRKDSPSPGLKRIKVKDGDSFASISAEYGLLCKDTCLMNYRTTRGDENDSYSYDVNLTFYG